MEVEESAGMGISDEDLSEKKELVISDEELSEEEKELRPIKKAPWIGILREPGLLEKIWDWEMLLPYKGDPDCSHYRIYCNYLEQYYGHHNSVITQAQISLFDAAKTCLEKEGELVSLWDSAMKECTEEILPISTFILSSLIKKFADNVKCPGKTFSAVCTAALLCITMEADLICKMLSFGAKPSDFTIFLSTKIRICALSLTSHQCCHSLPAAAAMLGIMKETKKICDWIISNNKAFDVNDEDLHNDFRLGTQVRKGTLHFMTRLLQKSPFPVSAAAEQKPVEGKYFSGDIHRNDENYIAPAEASNSTGDSTQDQEKVISTDSRKRMDLDSPIDDLEECDDAKTVPLVGSVRFVEMFEKTMLWDRLVPLQSSTEWSEYCNYLQQSYKLNAGGVAEVTVSVVAWGEVILKKEEELVSLLKTENLCSLIGILPVISIAQRNLIQELAHSLILSEDGRLPVASTVALECISKEADLICELLKRGAEPTDAVIKQSIMIRMCALGLVHLQGSRAFDAAAAMMGITKESKLICDWIKKEDNLITFGDVFTRERSLLRVRAIEVMLTILKASSFPNSKMWFDLVAFKKIMVGSSMQLL